MCPYSTHRKSNFGQELLDFYMKEHTKPFFFESGILTIGNFCNYLMCLEILKIPQSKLQACLYGYFNVSLRNTENLLLHGRHTYDYFHVSVSAWNKVIKFLARRISIPSISIVKF